mmetsp:Transcript_24831/g.42036  ORF Transcript_24831/g.42036 Transcript_24831/m.42036 type:complete len:277 (+) Transcript_24831:18-848(+)
MEKKLLPTAAFLGCVLVTLCTQRRKKKKRRSRGGGEEAPCVPSSKGADTPTDCGDCSLTDSAPKVDRHLILCGMASDTDWPKKIEKEQGSFASALSSALAGANTSSTSLSIKMTACNEPNSRAEYCDIIVYPEMLRFCVPLHDPSCITSFAEFVSLPCLSSTLPRAVTLSPLPLPGDTLLLVCTHGNRDKRCGRAGPIVLAALKEELEARGVPDSVVAVRATSHIGGHRYAGTLIVYPQGQWYGFMTKKTVKPLLDQVLAGGVLQKCFRGLGNPSW